MIVETSDLLEIYLDFVLTDFLRAVSEELAKERGRMPEGSEKHMPWGQVSWTYSFEAYQLVSWTYHALGSG